MCDCAARTVLAIQCEDVYLSDQRRLYRAIRKPTNTAGLTQVRPTNPLCVIHNRTRRSPCAQPPACELASSDPSTVQDCRIESWTGDGAIMYNLRGPLMLLDNHFTSTHPQPVVVYYFAGFEFGGLMLFSGNLVSLRPLQFGCNSSVRSTCSLATPVCVAAQRRSGNITTAIRARPTTWGRRMRTKILEGLPPGCSRSTRWIRCVLPSRLPVGRRLLRLSSGCCHRPCQWTEGLVSLPEIDVARAYGRD